MGVAQVVEPGAAIKGRDAAKTAIRIHQTLSLRYQGIAVQAYSPRITTQIAPWQAPSR
jgi:hypothetical protein